MKGRQGMRECQGMKGCQGMRGRLAVLCIVAAVFWTFSCLSTVRAESTAVESIMTGEDMGNGYQYTVPGIGRFYVNGEEGETLSAAVFSLDGGITPVLYRDGYKADFNDGVILDNGSYELRLYKEGKEDGSYGVFRFAIQNDYQDITDYDKKTLTVVENPELKLTYDGGEGYFLYTLPDGKRFASSIPAGGMGFGQAVLRPGEGLNVYRVLQNGEPVDFSEGLSFARPGSYLVTMRDNELGLDGDVSYRLDVCFRLCAERVMDISHINAPMGFRLASVKKDGKELKGFEKNYIHLTEDGSYELIFVPDEAEAGEGKKGGDKAGGDKAGGDKAGGDKAGGGKAGRDKAGGGKAGGADIVWKTCFVRDSTAPFLIFSQPADGQVLREELSFMPSEGGCRVRVERNLEEAETPGSRIVQDGRYHMEITDRAGNTRTYDFDMKQGFEILDRRMLIIPFMLFAAGGAVCIYCRRHMKVL